MVLTISTTHNPATDLGYLLHKNPSRLHEAEMPFGKVYVTYPEASEHRCTAALVLDVDPVALVRGRRGPSGEGGLFDQYVNDRPYAASSFMSTALREMFSTALSGRSKERQELADSTIDLEVRIPVIPCKGKSDLLNRLFEPLGYEVEAKQLTLDKRFEEWGASSYYDLTLRARTKLSDALCHLYVLIPVLDNDKHYWVDKDEIEKLLRRGGEWLRTHPERDEITRRYLRHQRPLTREALERLAEMDGIVDPDQVQEEHLEQEEVVEKPLSLHDIRLRTVLTALKDSGASRVLDLGCGEGKLLGFLMKERQFSEIVGMDVSIAALERAHQKLRVDKLPPLQAKRLKLMHSSLVYRDRRLHGYDAAAVVEVIEHLDAPRLSAFERNVFGFAKPGTVVVTTPNREYNILFETMEPGSFRHRDHRFEWTRDEFQQWAAMISEAYGYTTSFLPLGPEDGQHGAPSQMAVFKRCE